MVRKAGMVKEKILSISQVGVGGRGKERRVAMDWEGTGIGEEGRGGERAELE